MNGILLDIFIPIFYCHHIVKKSLINLPYNHISVFVQIIDKNKKEPIY
jgi:hypothetical protein